MDILLKLPCYFCYVSIESYRTPPFVLQEMVTSAFIVTAPVIVTSSLSGTIPPRTIKCLSFAVSLSGFTLREYDTFASE